MTDQKNTILAIVLSALVLIGWQLYFGLPQVEKQKQIQQQQAQEHAQPGAPAPQAVPSTQSPPAASPQAPAQPGAVPGRAMTREEALAASPRVRVETPSVAGSISLKGGRIDDLSLIKYHETVDPGSPPIVLLAPSGSPSSFYSEFGWSAASGTTVKLPGPDTLWQQTGGGTLSVGRPVTLVYDNGEGLEFRRTIAVDDKYLFTIKDEVVNKGASAITLYPYALISRHGTPHTLGYYILHEGMIGVLDDKLQEASYSDIEKKKNIAFTSTNAWLGITEKYWAATLLPPSAAKIYAQFSFFQNGIQPVSDLLQSGSRHRGCRRDQRGRHPVVCRRQGILDCRRLQSAARAQQIRPADRLGLVLFHHQADVLRAGLDLSPRRQFRRGDSDHHRHHQGFLFPARQQVLRLHGQDEGGAAGDDGDPRALRRRQDEAAAGDDGALQEGESESGRRLPADAHPGPGLLFALQGAVRHHRPAARPVLRLDQGPFGARSAPRCSTCSG